GVIYSGLAIYDTMQYIKADVSTICVGMAASRGALLLSAGTKGKRFALPNSRMMIHQPMGGAQGQASQIEIQAKEILLLKSRINEIRQQTTCQPLEQIQQDTDRDYYISAKAAVAYGIIYGVLTKRQVQSNSGQ